MYLKTTSHFLHGVLKKTTKEGNIYNNTEIENAVVKLQKFIHLQNGGLARFKQSENVKY
jgi:hypothetical protein